MTSYRFCRSDDIPLLVEAHNLCFHGAEIAADAREPPAPLTVASFKELIRRLDLWTSSCMVAFEDRRPIAVLLAAKRETESWIHSVAVAPEQRRRGHGSHLLTSLSQKMAILGPPRMIAEVPADNEAAARLVRRCGYRIEAELVDYSADPLSGAATSGGALATLGLEDVLRHAPLDPTLPRPWERSLPALEAQRDELLGLGLVGGAGIEAWALFTDRPPWREIVELGCASPERTEPMLGVVLQGLRSGSELPIRMRRVGAGEPMRSWHAAWSFRPGATYLAWAASAASA